MNENEIVVENTLDEVAGSIRNLKQRKTVFGGFDKEYVLGTVQEICGIYEKKIEALTSENKEKLDLLNGEIAGLRQQNAVLSRKITADPAVIEKANKAITDANARIESANAYITKLLALYDEAEAKIKEQAAEISELRSGAAKTAPAPVEEAAPTQEAAPVAAAAPVQQTPPAPAIVSPQTNCVYPQGMPYPPSLMYPQNYPYPQSLAAPVNYVFNPQFGWQPIYMPEANRREALIENQEVIEKAKSAAEKIISMAKEDADMALRQAKEEAEKTLKLARKEADRLRELARDEAETIIRDRRFEIRAEERLHQEAIDELKARYLKYGEFFTKMMDEVNRIQGDIVPRSDS